MKLRTGMLLGIVALVAAIVAATAFAVGLFVDRAEQRRLRGDLARSTAVFERLLGYRASMERSDCAVVANEPRLRAVVATQDISRETIVGVIAELRTSLGSDLFLLADPEGHLIADAADPAASGGDLSGKPGIAAAKRDGEGSAVWIAGDRAYQVSACRVTFGEQVAGLVALGHAIDDTVAAAVRDQTGSTLIITLDGRPVAASALASGQPAGAEPLPALGDAPVELVRGGDRYLARGGPFPGYTGARALRYTILRSLDEALAPGRSLRRTVFAIAGGALVAGLALALALSSLLSRPVGDLVRFTRAIAQGRLSERAAPAGVTEVRALAVAMNAMVDELDRSRRSLAEKQRLERELEIASRIQTSILPKKFAAPGLEIAAQMIPASEVGGDYYDVFPTERGCWIGIGDVAGHGLPAGLEMLMVQSVVAALVRRDPAASPAEHVRVLNRVLYENIRERLGQDEHITLTLLRYEAGAVTFAGAHEEILVCRAASGALERIATPGTWLGGMPDVSRVTRDSSFPLEVGDLIVLYTDGLTEARNAEGRQFGDGGLEAALAEVRGEPVGAIRDRLIAAARAWQAEQPGQAGQPEQPEQSDDISVVVIRRVA